MSNASGFLRLFFRKNLFSEQKACFFAFWGHEKGLLHQIIKSLMQQPHQRILMFYLFNMIINRRDRFRKCHTHHNARIFHIRSNCLWIGRLCSGSRPGFWVHIIFACLLFCLISTYIIIKTIVSNNSLILKNKCVLDRFAKRQYK